MSRRGSVYCFCALMGSPAVLLAQDLDARKDGAIQLYDAGVRKMDAAGSRTPEACQDFRQSVALYEGAYNWIQVGKCGSQEGDYRGAVQAFENARGWLQRREEYRDKYDALLADIESGLANIGKATLVLPVRDLPADPQFWLDGKLLDAKPGSEIPVEIKPHTVRVTAPGYETIELPVDLRAPEPFFVVIPLNQWQLVAPPPPPPPADDGVVQRRWGYAVGGIGLGVLAFAGGLWLHARSLHEDSGGCADPEDPDCQQARSYQKYAIATATVGGLAVVGGTVLVLTGLPPKTARSSSTRASLTVGLMGLGLQAAVAW